MKTISKGFAAALALTALGTHVADASSLTYSFTGVVTGALGNFATYNGQSVIGDEVTGTFVFNYDAAIPAQSVGTPGSNAWNSHSDFVGTFPQGGSLADLLVFTSTGQVVGTNISYATFPPDPNFSIGSYATGTNGSTFQAYEQATQANGGDTQSIFGIGSNGTPVYDSNGGPVYPPSLPPGSGSGYFAVAHGSNLDQITYNITSISAVPLPAVGWLLAPAFGMFAVRRRRALPA